MFTYNDQEPVQTSWGCGGGVAHSTPGILHLFDATDIPTFGSLIKPVDPSLLRIFQTHKIKYTAFYT